MIKKCSICHKNISNNFILNWNNNAVCSNECWNKAIDNCQEYDLSLLRKDLLKKSNE